MYRLMIITVYCGFNAMCSSSQDYYYDHYENCLTQYSIPKLPTSTCILLAFAVSVSVCIDMPLISQQHNDCSKDKLFC